MKEITVEQARVISRKKEVFAPHILWRPNGHEVCQLIEQREFPNNSIRRVVVLKGGTP